VAGTRRDDFPNNFVGDLVKTARAWLISIRTHGSMLCIIWPGRVTFPLVWVREDTMRLFG
jgi:hypothetical protein